MNVVVTHHNSSNVFLTCVTIGETSFLSSRITTSPCLRKKRKELNACRTVICTERKSNNKIIISSSSIIIIIVISSSIVTTIII
jgi:hypothetical protein